MYYTTPYEIYKDTWALCDPRFPVFLIKRKNRHILIEPEISGCWELLLGHLNTVGIDLEEIDGCVVLHEHYDHLMLLPKLLEARGNIKIYGDRNLREILKKRDLLELYIQADEFSSQKTYRSSHPPKTPQLEIEVEPLESLEKYNIETFNLPGHSPLSKGILLGEGIFFVSDSLGFFGKELGYCPLYFHNYNEYLASIERIKNLRNRFHTIITGHNAIFMDKEVDEAIETAIEKTVELREKIDSLGLTEEDKDYLLEEIYKGEFLLYPREIIANCARYLIKRSIS
ncbi:MAG: MBL fold metallo-hydrolase [Thermosulfidibacteraceae bacterium]|jgi:glyoxylase-like metal-dependent hydrolase (beta-lactamase superfamily II)